MKYDVAIALGDKVVDVVEITDVRDVLVSHGTYYLKGNDGKNLFTAPLEKVAYIKKAE